MQTVYKFELFLHVPPENHTARVPDCGVLEESGYLDGRYPSHQRYCKFQYFISDIVHLVFNYFQTFEVKSSYSLKHSGGGSQFNIHLLLDSSLYEYLIRNLHEQDQCR